LIRTLGCFRYLTTPQAAELLFAGSRLNARSADVVAARLLAGLRREGLVTTNAHQAGQPDAAPTRVVHFLTAAGRRAFVRCEPDAPRRRAAVGGSVLVSHSLMLADVALAFRRSALEHVGHELERWDCDWQIGQKLAGTQVVPDAYLIYTTSRHKLHSFVEADRGTEGSRFFSGKILRYLDLHASGRWRGSLAVWPLTLTLTPTERRAFELCAATAVALSSRPDAPPASAFRFAPVDDVRGRGPLNRIWFAPARRGRQGIAELPDGSDFPLDADRAGDAS